jgi:hypothetical protein
MPAGRDLRLCALVWMAGSLLAWVVFPYVGDWLTPALEMHLWADVARLTLWLTGNGLLLGLVTALAQAAALPAGWGSRRRWFVGTLLGYALALPLGFLMAVLGIWALAQPALPQLLQPSSLTLYYPVALALLGSGLVLALVQWRVSLAGWPLSLKAQELWLLSGILIWGLGFSVAGYAQTAGMPENWRSAVVGGVVGLLSFSLLAWLHRAGMTAAAPAPAGS